MISLENVIVATSYSGERYIGVLDVTPTSVSCNVPYTHEGLTTIKDARKVLSQYSVGINPSTQKVENVTMFSVAVAVDQSPVLRSITIRMADWYLVSDQSSDTKEVISLMLQEAEERETTARMAKSGLIPANNLPQNIRRPG